MLTKVTPQLAIEREVWGGYCEFNVWPRFMIDFISDIPCAMLQDLAVYVESDFIE